MAPQAEQTTYPPQQMASRSFRAPQVTIDDAKTNGSDVIFVSIKNLDPSRVLTTGYTEFRLLNASGVISTNDWTEAYWTGEGFPIIIDIHPGETAVGYLVFDSCDCNPPYTLVFEHPGGTIRLPVETAATDSSEATTTSSAPLADSPEANDLVLVMSDMPSGWMGEPPVAAPTVANTTDNASAEIYRGAGGPSYIQTWAWVFNSVADAVAYFEEQKTEVKAEYSTDSVAAGDDAFVWKAAEGYQEEGLARDGRVVWHIFAAGDTGYFSPTTASLLKQAVSKL